MFSFSKQSPGSISFASLLLLLLPLLALTFLIISYTQHDFRLLPSFTACSSTPSSFSSFDNSSSAAASPTPPPEFRLLIGVITHPDYFERRQLLRMVYSLQQEQPNLLGAQVDVRFVLCNLTTEEQRVFVALEIMRYDDIIILDCAENMDDGKTYAYFASLPTLFNGTGDGSEKGDGSTPPPPPYDFVMKADDDIYFRLPRLVAALRDKPREDMYFGLQEPCDDENFFPFPPFMEGMGYVVSWDLVRWIATSDVARNDVRGPEDMWVGRWFNLADKAKNRFDAAPAMYDFRGPFEKPNCFRRDFVPDTIAVHKLKNNARWAKTLSYFEVTKALKPSKLYHIP